MALRIAHKSASRISYISERDEFSSIRIFRRKARRAETYREDIDSATAWEILI